MTVGEFLAKCQPLEIIALLAVAAAALVGIVGLVVWRQVRLKQMEGALKQEAIRKGLSVAEVQQLLSSVPYWLAAARKPRTDAEAVQKVAQELASHGASGPELEQHLALVQAADSATKQAIAESFIGMCDEGTRPPDKEQLLAVVRGLCGAARPAGNAEQRTQVIRIKPSAAGDRPPE